MAITKAIHDQRYIQVIARLRQARKQAGLTQADVAERLGLDQTSISKVETCERRIDVIELIDFCRTVGVKISDLVDTTLQEYV